MSIPDMSGVPPLAAIRQFSDPVAWAEFELLLGLEGGDAEARAGWNTEEWARYDFQIVLKLEVARKKLSEYLHAWHRWARLRLAFKKRLQSGELVATGYVKPVKVPDSRITIPADKWRFLEMEFRNGAASGEGLEIVSILVCRADYVDEAPTKPTIAAEPDGRKEHTPLDVAVKKKPEIEKGNKAVATPRGTPRLASQSSQKRRRGGAKPGPYYSKLKKLMALLYEKDSEKFENGTPAELRRIVKRRFKNDGVLRYPKRSGLDKAIAKAKQEVIDSDDRL